MAIEKLLTLRECSELTGHSVATWRSWVLHRKIPFFKIGRSVRVAEADLECILDQSRIPAKKGLK